MLLFVFLCDLCMFSVCFCMILSTTQPIIFGTLSSIIPECSAFSLVVILKFRTVHVHMRVCVSMNSSLACIFHPSVWRAHLTGGSVAPPPRSVSLSPQLHLSIAAIRSSSVRQFAVFPTLVDWFGSSLFCLSRLLFRGLPN